MATLPAKRAVEQEISDQLAKLASDLTKNGDIERFSINVNKKSGLIRTNAKSFDGVTRTHVVQGPGLVSVTTHIPSDRQSLAANVRTRRREGLTQQETATTLGVSQALVSNIDRGT